MKATIIPITALGIALVLVLGAVFYALGYQVQQSKIIGQQRVDEAVKQGCKKFTHNGSQWVYHCPDGAWLESEIIDGVRK